MPSALELLRGDLGEPPALLGAPKESAVSLIRRSFQSQEEEPPAPETPFEPDTKFAKEAIPAGRAQAFARGIMGQQTELGGLLPNIPEKFAAGISPLEKPKSEADKLAQETRLTQDEIEYTRELANRYPGELQFGKDVGGAIDAALLVKLAAKGAVKGTMALAGKLGKKFPDNLVLQAINRDLTRVREFGLRPEIGTRITTGAKQTLDGIRKSREIGIATETEKLSRLMTVAEARAGTDLSSGVGAVIAKHSKGVAVDAHPLLAQIEKALTKEGVLRLGVKPKPGGGTYTGYILPDDVATLGGRVGGLVEILRAHGGTAALDVMKKHIGGTVLPIPLEDAHRTLSNLSKLSKFERPRANTAEFFARRARHTLRDQIVRGIARVDPGAARSYDRAMKDFSTRFGALNDFREIVPRGTSATKAASTAGKLRKAPADAQLAVQIDKRLARLGRVVGKEIPETVGRVRDLQRKIDILDRFPSDPVALERFLFKLDDRDMRSVLEDLEVLAKTEGARGRAIAKMVPNLKAAITARSIHEPLLASMRVAETAGAPKAGLLLNVTQGAGKIAARGVEKLGRAITIPGIEGVAAAAKGALPGNVRFRLLATKIAKEFSRNEYMANAYLTKMPEEIQGRVLKYGADYPPVKELVHRFFVSKAGATAIMKVAREMSGEPTEVREGAPAVDVQPSGPEISPTAPARTFDINDPALRDEFTEEPEE